MNKSTTVFTASESKLADQPQNTMVPSDVLRLEVGDVSEPGSKPWFIVKLEPLTVIIPIIDISIPQQHSGSRSINIEGYFAYDGTKWYATWPLTKSQTNSVTTFLIQKEGRWLGDACSILHHDPEAGPIIIKRCEEAVREFLK